MAGHSKWKQIKHKKAAADAEKSRTFGKLVAFIKTEARRSGGSESPGLRAAIENARAANVPKETIERAVKSGATSGDTATAAVFEAYGPGGVALIIETTTDNTNRTSQELRHCIETNGGTFAAPGAASWAFDRTDAGWTPKQFVELSESDRAALDTLLDTIATHEAVTAVHHTAS